MSGSPGSDRFKLFYVAPCADGIHLGVSFTSDSGVDPRLELVLW